MAFIEVNEQTKSGKQLLAFLKTQAYVKVFDEYNVETKTTIEDVENKVNLNSTKSSAELFNKLGIY